MALILVGGLPTYAIAQTRTYVDPYADEAKKQILKEYQQRKSYFLNDVEELYFAVGCKVFPNEGSILPLMAAESRVVTMGGPPVMDMHGQEDIRSAAQRGITHSKVIGECDFWRNNPEQLGSIRRRAQNAFP